MSQADQRKFLQTLIDELDSTKVEAYRRAKADKQHHNFTMSRGSVRKGLRDYLKKEKVDKKDIDSILGNTDKDVKAFIKAVKTECARLASRDSTVKAVLGANTAARIAYTFEVKNGKSRYDKIGGTDGVYSKKLKILGIAFEKECKKQVKTKDLLQLSHAEFAGIIESAVSDAIDKAVASQAAIGRAEAKRFLRGRGIDLRVVRDTKTDQMNVELASGVDNTKDNKVAKARLAGMRKALLKAMNQLNKEGRLLNLPGSDSFKQLKKKKLLNAVLDPFSTKKNIKVTPKHKIKHSKTTSKKNIKANDLILAKKFKKRRVKKSPTTRKLATTSSPLAMIAMINKELPKTVQDNMGAPALENITGRFARSVRATDVVQTPKGFPSIGYTYRRDPYQVFEDGSKGAWSDGHRDPRKLIDASIREIAVKMAIGRFYTRRV